MCVINQCALGLLAESNVAPLPQPVRAPSIVACGPERRLQLSWLECPVAPSIEQSGLRQPMRAAEDQVFAILHEFNDSFGEVSQGQASKRVWDERVAHFLKGPPLPLPLIHPPAANNRQNLQTLLCVG
ncbi:hypothetical protein K469DRAFT_30844 [Zopfia rhizophila CBS 207.26]|uniref:Uncharacterized protein n=1 Tax=Zopfia rhizophila CBS 207.26 TaxID=1314779 RepID=A0A6A6DA45_9PEZI|nr:hypothetical protein K469DRAFT_30844 [Zopfia rhizophila CBS 207.26]